MYLHTKYGTATINNTGDLLWVHFFQDLTPKIKVTVAERERRKQKNGINSEPIYEDDKRLIDFTFYQIFCIQRVSNNQTMYLNN